MASWGYSTSTWSCYNIRWGSYNYIEDLRKSFEGSSKDVWNTLNKRRTLKFLEKGLGIWGRGASCEVLNGFWKKINRIFWGLEELMESCLAPFAEAL